MLLLIIGILLTVFSFITRKKYNPIIPMIVVFVIMGFQSNVLSDYQNYLDAYSYMQTNGKMDVRTSEDEPIWAALFWAFSQVFPYWLFILLLAIVQCYVLYLFIK